MPGEDEEEDKASPLLARVSTTVPVPVPAAAATSVDDSSGSLGEMGLGLGLGGSDCPRGCGSDSIRGVEASLRALLPLLPLLPPPPPLLWRAVGNERACSAPVEEEGDEE